MKKCILLIAIALCLSGCQLYAQDLKFTNLNEFPPYYLSMDDHPWMTDFNNTGVTSAGYHFKKREDAGLCLYLDESYIYHILTPLSTDYAMVEYVPDSTVTVIGVAYGTFYRLSPYVDSTRFEYARNHIVGELYVPYGDGFETYSARYMVDDLNDAKGMFTYLTNGIDPNPAKVRNLVAEMYFDNPIVLSDTFYVGLVNTLDTMPQGYKPDIFTHDLYECNAGFRIFEERHYATAYDPTTLGYYPPYDYPLRHYRFRSKHYLSNGVWIDTMINSVPLVWPIIQLNGDVCDKVENLEAVQVDDDAMYLTWDAGVNHSKWQVSYGPEGTPPGGGTVFETTVPQKLITGLAHDTRYVAYVHSYCDLAKAKWAPWSDAVSVNIGIQDEPQADVPLAVYPNPTKGTFRIEADVTITAVELYDLGGTAVLSLPVNNTGMGIDISALPEGTYILAAHTDNGLATRRIVKQ